MVRKLNDNNNSKKKISKESLRKRNLKEAENYGWVVEDWQAREAYDFACEYFGKEDLDDQIVGAISNEELAACLAFIFRMNDFREWDEYLEGQEDEGIDESVRCIENNTEEFEFDGYSFDPNSHWTQIWKDVIEPIIDDHFESFSRGLTSQEEMEDDVDAIISYFDEEFGKYPNVKKAIDKYNSGE